MIPIQQSLRLSAVCAVLIFCFLQTFDLSAQNKVTFSIQNRQTNAGVYSAELWAGVTAGSTWVPGNCIITIDYNHAAPSVGSFHMASLQNPDPELNGGGYLPMYQSNYGNALSVNIINLSGNFASKTGSFRIGTLRWTILNGFLLDSLRFATSGTDSCIISDGWDMMWYNCGTAECYGITNPTPAQTGNPPVITQQPQSLAACLGSSTSLSVTATSAFTYRWEKLNGSTWQTVSGATSSSLSFPNIASDDAGSYRVVMTGNAPPIATSSTVTVSLFSAPAVISHPTFATICAGSDAGFSAGFSGTPTPALTWEVSSDNGASWVPIPGVAGTTLTISSASMEMSGYQYRAKATNTCNFVITNPAMLTVHSAPVITAQTSSAVATVGDSVSLSVTATGSGLSYRWQKNGVDIPGASSATLSFTNVQLSDLALYRAIITGLCTGSATSNQIPLIVFAEDTTKTTLVVKALMQGYWNGTTHARTPVSVELRSGVLPISSTLATIGAGILESDGTITLDFDNIQSGNYWIIVRHGGYLPVASATAVQITRGGTISYDFSDAAGKAYLDGTMAVLIGGQTYYVLKGGDLNGNRAVNPQDLPLFLIGYPKTNASSVPGL